VLLHVSGLGRIGLHALPDREKRRILLQCQTGVKPLSGQKKAQPAGVAPDPPKEEGGSAKKEITRRIRQVFVRRNIQARRGTIDNP